MAKATAWIVGIVGGVVMFVGSFILFGGDDESLGLGGDLSWRVGDIDSGWGYGFVIGGAVLLAGAIVLAISGRRSPRSEAREDLMALVTHAVVFTVVNALIWAQDIAAGGGLDYALWITVPWGIGLIAHGASFAAQARETRDTADEIVSGRDHRESQLH